MARKKHPFRKDSVSRAADHTEQSDIPRSTSAEPEFPSRKVETILIEDTGLTELRSRPQFFRYLVQLWRSRHFIYAKARTTAFSRGRDRYLGGLWELLDPIFQVSVYAVIFGFILNVSRGMDNFIGFLVLGVIYFGFLSTGIAAGSGLIKGSRGLISSFKFPRAALICSTALKNLLNSIVPAILAVIIAVLFQLDKPIHWTSALVIPLFLLIQVFNFGVTCFVARATAFVPDLQSLVNLIRRGLFFISGVFFTISRFDTHPVLESVVEANPLYQFLMAIRSCVLEGVIPSLAVWGYLSVWSFSLAALGILFFWQAEERYASVR